VKIDNGEILNELQDKIKTFEKENRILKNELETLKKSNIELTERSNQIENRNNNPRMIVNSNGFNIDLSSQPRDLFNRISFCTILF